MCSSNKQKLLETTHSGPVEYCETSPIFICGGEEILGHRETAKAKFETCLANDKDARCTQSLNNDAATRGNGGPYISPTPKDMTAPIGNNCKLQYWYCENKIYTDKASYDADKRCIKGIAKYHSLHDFPGYERVPACIKYSKCMGRIP